MSRFGSLLALITILAGMRGFSYAQPMNVDSLALAADSMPDDTNKVLAYLRLFKPSIMTNAEQAMSYVEKALGLSLKLGYRHGEGESYRFQGIYYMVNGASDLALERYQLAHKNFKELRNKGALVRVSNNFATVFMELEQFDSALTYLKAIDDFDAANANDSIMKATFRHNVGICRDMLGDHEDAYRIFEENLAVFKKLNVQYEQSFTLNSLGETAMTMGKPQLALGHLYAAEALKRELEDLRGLSNAQQLLSKAYQKLGKADSALVIGERGMQTALLAADINLVHNAHRILAEANALAGRYAPAYTHLFRHVELGDSLNKAATDAKMMRMQSAYGLKLQNEEIQQLQQAGELDQANLHQQRIINIALVGVIVLVLIVLWVLVRASRARARLNAQLQGYLAQINIKNSEISAKNDALSSANTALGQSIEEREALLQMVIHDLKSPLTSTSGLAQLLLSSEDIPEMGKKIAGKITATNQRGLELISDLLALYEVEAKLEIEKTRVPISDILQVALASCEGHAATKGISLDLEIEAGLETVHTNASMCTRIVENFLSNAVKFSPKGTHVFLKAAKAADGIRISIVDQGPGISEQDQSRLFRKFAKLTARPTGGEQSNGLGLAIVKQLAERLGGTVHVASELGKGSTFSVLLPD